VAALLFGAAFPLCRRLAPSWDPVPLAGALYLGSGLGLGVARLFIRKGAPLRRIDLPWLAGAVLFGGVLAPIAYVYGSRLTAGYAGALLSNLEIVFTAAIAVAFFRERLSRRETAALVLLVAGATVVALSTVADGDARSSILGGILVAAACLGWGIDNNFTKKIADRDPLQIASVKGLVAGATSLGVGLLLGQRVPMQAVSLAAAGAIGLACYGISLVLFVLALRKLGSARASAVFAVASLSGVAVSWIVLHEKPRPLAAVGGIVVVACVYWMARLDAAKQAALRPAD